MGGGVLGIIEICIKILVLGEGMMLFVISTTKNMTFFMHDDVMITMKMLFSYSVGDYVANWCRGWFVVVFGGEGLSFVYMNWFNFSSFEVSLKFNDTMIYLFWGFGFLHYLLFCFLDFSLLGGWVYEGNRCFFFCSLKRFWGFFL